MGGVDRLADRQRLVAKGAPALADYAADLERLVIDLRHQIEGFEATIRNGCRSEFPLALSRHVHLVKELSEEPIWLGAFYCDACERGFVAPALPVAIG